MECKFVEWLDWTHLINGHIQFWYLEDDEIKTFII